MKLLAVVASLITLFSVSSCRKEVDINPTQESFPIRYYFINASAGQLNAVNLTTNTYFPKINQTNIYYKNFSRVRVSDSLLISVDTSSATKSWGYIGCKTQLEINVIEQRPGSILYVSTWLTKQDSIKTKADAQLYFVWPKDTLIAKKTAGYYVK
jgi:hypothetical protein